MHNAQTIVLCAKICAPHRDIFRGEFGVRGKQGLGLECWMQMDDRGWKKHNVR
jgi:hypothetical protein